MALVINEADPCAAAATLRQVYANIVAGQATQEVMFRAGSGGVERRVAYSKADPAALLTLIREYESKCAALQPDAGKRPRRFAVRAGGRF